MGAHSLTIGGLTKPDRAARLCEEVAVATTTLEVRTPAGTVPVPVVRKRVKNLNLRVHRDGTVSLSIPTRTPLAVAQDFLNRRAGWIAAHIERVHTRAAERTHAGATADGLVPLWGRLQPAPGGAEEIEALYRREVARALPSAIARGEARVGVHAAGWQIRRMTSRWGSCTPARRTIRINSALAAYPPECLDYVVIHELTHLLEPSHNARFHALLDRFCPRNREIARILKRPAATVASNLLG